MRSVLLIISVIALCSFNSGDKEAVKGYQVGDKAADFSLKNIDGNMISLSDMNDAKGFIITFTCNHCPFAKLYEDRLIALDKKYKSKGYPVVAINPNDTTAFPSDNFSSMQVRAKEKGFTFPYLIDDTQKVAKAFGAARTPHVYIVKKVKNEFEVVYIGAIDDNSKSEKDVKEKYVEQAIEALLKDKKVDPNFTKAVGCSIKWIGQGKGH